MDAREAAVDPDPHRKLSRRKGVLVIDDPPVDHHKRRKTTGLLVGPPVDLNEGKDKKGAGITREMEVNRHPEITVVKGSITTRARKAEENIRAILLGDHRPQRDLAVAHEIDAGNFRVLGKTIEDVPVAVAVDNEIRRKVLVNIFD